VHIRTAALLLAAAAAPALACDPVVGSPAVHRAREDASQGVVSIYRGQGPVAGPATLTDWRFFDDNAPQNAVTPLLFKDHGTHLELVGVGTTRYSLADGLVQHPFEPIAGTDQLDAGSNYTFGFTTRGFVAGPTPGSLVFQGSSIGSIDFDGYNNFTDPWDYALPGALTLNQIYGPGGESLNPFGFAGRIYSAQFLLDCNAPCPADLAPPFGVLNFFDVSAFIAAYNSQNPAADFAAPFGVFNFFDVSAFIAAYNAGCP
jgi:hypothetical protein